MKHSRHKMLYDSPKKFKIIFVDDKVMWITSTERTINEDARKIELELNKEIKEVVSYGGYV